MFFRLNPMRSGVFRSTQHFKRHGAAFPSLHNLKAISTNNGIRYSIRENSALSLSNEPVKKFVKFVVEEFENGRNIGSDVISEQGSNEIYELLKARSNVEESMKSLDDLVRQDAEMKKIGEEEYASYEKELEHFDEELLNSVLRNVGRENCRDIILEIMTGVGGQESTLFLKDLFDMYVGYLDYLDFSYEIMDQDSSPSGGGMRHATIAISGDRALEMFRHEGGVHRVQRIPATEKSGRIHTSTVSVAILPQPNDIEVVIKDKDVRIETKNASGAGGQHVNTTDSAVRITHLPTGISVESQSDRSQIKNRSIAMLRLRTKIYEKQLNAQLESSGEMRKKQIGLGLRNEKIRTYNFNQDRITDHRIADGTMHNLKGFLEGGQLLWELQKKLQQDLQMKMLRDAIRKAIK